VARTLAALAGTGVLSTVGRDGWAAGSVVQTAADADGAPVLALSSLSAHTRELTADPRCALTLLAPGFAGMQDARATLTCVARALEGEAAAAARAVFMAAHPDAFWADFGDFSWWRLDPTGGARVVAGFGRAGSVSADQYRAAAPDPVAPFAPPVCGHMNADHGDAVAAMVAAAAGGAQAGVTIERATMLSVDRLGFDADAVVAGAGGGVVRARVPFSAPADDRKALKERLVELTRAAAAAASK
jgi:putative heme iron utilization protein